MARPKGVKVSALTPDNVAALTACRDQYGLLPKQLVITPTTATWPLTFNAAGALQTVLDAIAQTQGTTRRALHAPRRKLEKLVRPDSRPVVPTPDPPKASKRLTPATCDHVQPEGLHGLTELRAKCLACGLVIDRPKAADRPRRATTARQKPARTTPAVPAASPAPKPQKAAQPRYARARHGDSFLVIDMHGGLVIATATNPDAAALIVAALNRKDPQT